MALSVVAENGGREEVNQTPEEKEEESTECGEVRRTMTE